MRRYHLVNPVRFIAFLTLCFTFFLLVFVTGSVYSSSADKQETYTMTISQGDTLWSIASDITQPHEDIRNVISDIKKINHLDRSDLQMGKSLLIPVREVH